jgi:hypothetical protein
LPRRAAAPSLIALFPGPQPGDARHPAIRSKENMKDMHDKGDMNNATAGPCGRAGRPRRLRAGALAAALTGTALLGAACSGSSAGADTFAPGATYAQTLAFAKCMRANGVPLFPNPDRQGNFNSNNPQVQALNGGVPAQRTVSPQRNALFQCRSVLPNADTGLTMEQMQQIGQQNVDAAVKAASCMRAHGITNFPDPKASNLNEGGGVTWQPVSSAIQAGVLSLNTPSYEAAFLACNGGKVLGGAIPPNFAPGHTCPYTQCAGDPPPGTPPPVSGNGP